LVENEKQNLLVSVNRNSPEEKLDDFLDKAIQLSQVIQSQHALSSKSTIRKVFLRNSRLWFHLNYFITLVINGILLFRSSCNTDNGWYNYSSSTGSSDPTCILDASNPDFLEPSLYNAICVLGWFHLAGAVILVTLFGVGKAQVIVGKGWKWRRMVETEMIVLDEKDTLFFKFASRYLHPWVWTMYFLGSQAMVWYYMAYLACSFLGAIHSHYWFCLHVLDICNRNQILLDVVHSVTDNVSQILATFALFVCVVWIFAVTFWGLYGPDDWSIGGAPIISLKNGFLQHINFGLRNVPEFSDAKISIAQQLFELLYDFLVLLIMVAIITGIIINAFADKRSANLALADDIQNTCFICSLKRDVFERKRIAFTQHAENDHNVWNYVYYRMYVDKKPNGQLTAIEGELKEKINKQDISFFPIRRALVLQREEDTGELDQLSHFFNTIEAQVENVKVEMKTEIQQLSHYVESQVQMVLDLLQPNQDTENEPK